jgi:Fe-S-cluster containining protein
MMPQPSPSVLDPAPFRAELKALYASLDAAVARIGPVCALSGRCCRFTEWGHTLFLSAPEFAVLLADAPAPSRAVDDGATCPWQDARGHCTARDARPLGCRVYYCDSSFEASAAALSEEFIAYLKRLVATRQLPWQYAPLYQHLRSAQAAGLLAAPAAPKSRGHDTTNRPDDAILA